MTDSLKDNDGCTTIGDVKEYGDIKECEEQTSGASTAFFTRTDSNNLPVPHKKDSPRVESENLKFGTANTDIETDIELANITECDESDSSNRALVEHSYVVHPNTSGVVVPPFEGQALYLNSITV